MNSFTVLIVSVNIWNIFCYNYR